MIELDNLEGASKACQVQLSTVGDGYWSDRAASVLCTKLVITYVAAHDNEGEDLPADAWVPDFGELQVTFDAATWNPEEHGLIYTDSRFIFELQTYLECILGFSAEAAADVTYSEQGMQGDDFVSCDVGGKFLAEAAKIFSKE